MVEFKNITFGYAGKNTNIFEDYSAFLTAEKVMHWSGNQAAERVRLQNFC